MYRRITLKELDEMIKTNKLMKQMEEMAKAPKEPMGKREPGEKGSYERKQSSIDSTMPLGFN